MRDKDWGCNVFQISMHIQAHLVASLMTSLLMQVGRNIFSLSSITTCVSGLALWLDDSMSLHAM